ncbi:hypothetical protein PF005_g23413 [Phytophthora fragariae]|uniref:Uncharacterized protein n=1 Tax=Phytophthora fragariae TaxID=53985 RepID=A0A6A4EAI8_9STRA|nr:hypothetical protein PF003_g34116 [Phytophthora fragariae]KAE8925078.1 hypothetical protein PF009_g24704 [Phytophthora fragariae]KAE8986152.1 hypothetical protein PF011_g20109 [Phytophthora fragariae]KAE9081065.1 hypothetical protein PF010_g22137 [Phytophthora fragariae]KAE9082087.1 hypothetical protein PF007_g22408 [Phytophthora fragariae]
MRIKTSVVLSPLPSPRFRPSVAPQLASCWCLLPLGASTEVCSVTLAFSPLLLGPSCSTNTENVLVRHVAPTEQKSRPRSVTPCLPNHPVKLVQGRPRW